MDETSASRLDPFCAGHRSEESVRAILLCLLSFTNIPNERSAFYIVCTQLSKDTETIDNR
jgi:hypothetical protein